MYEVDDTAKIAGFCSTDILNRLTPVVELTVKFSLAVVKGAWYVGLCG